MKAEELLRRMGTKDGPLLLDPRSPFEFRRGHVPGAVNAPVWKILLGTAQLPQNRSREMVIACMHGQRAYIANWILVLMGYRNLEFLDGFLEDWLAAGLPWTSRPSAEGKASPQRERRTATARPLRPVASAEKSASGPARAAPAVSSVKRTAQKVKQQKPARKRTRAAPAASPRRKAAARSSRIPA